MNLSGLLPLIQNTPSLRQVRPALGEPSLRLTVGVADAAKAATIAALAAELAAPFLVVVPRSDRAEALAEELAIWLGDTERIYLFPERDPLPYERLAPDPEAVAARLRLLGQLGEDASPVIVASAKALAQRTLSPHQLAEARRDLKLGDALEPEAFLAELSALGYAIEPLVERAGQASRRGGIIDVFPPLADQPVRIELLGRRVESLRRFDPRSQRSVQPLESVVIGPAREAVWRRNPGIETRDSRLDALDYSRCPLELRERFSEELAFLRQGIGFPADYFYVAFLAQATLIDHLPEGALVLCDEYSDLTAALDELNQQAQAARDELEAKGEIPGGLPLPYVPWRELAAGLEGRPRLLYLSRWASGEEKEAVRLPFGPATAYGGQLRRVVADVVPSIRESQRVVVVSQQAPRLSELFTEQDMPASPQAELTSPPSGLALVLGSLSGGWRLREEGVDLTLLTDREIFGFTKQRRAQPRKGISREAFLAELSRGDYVVHIEHGIGRFAGLVRMAIDGNEREYLELHYAEGDKLLVPTDQLDRVSRYVGPGDYEPHLTRLGSGEWQRTKQRVRRAVADLARELLALYAARELVPGYSFAADTPWQLELEASFPYIETPDQLTAVAEVKRDMEKPRPMDRLVCGDVGYGKTEVALRAAFKAVMDGRQVAVLVPTTVLAQQHYDTFSQRLSTFPVRLEMLSRFRTDSEQRQVVDELAKGGLDIVIGTHRLLQKDVGFKNLGLVIIDEEQRFGVGHKEHLKQMRKEVDVLTLSATPIPRTLYMALGGIRDMSAMETPPEERLPIKTYVSEFDEHLVREAIVRELERGGQVYFVHNRVHNIEYISRKVQDIVPEAIVSIAHGQMDERELARIMLEFVQGRIDVLVCTTIIESGLDIPNVNTIIVNQADKLGLGQLYQLRGRVGRGAHRAYAYLLYDRKARLTEAAQKRLQTIFEATELGAGFQIALRDLEIRGAGNLLGPEQSGHMAAVGFDLYCRLLADAVERLRALMRGDMPPPPREGPDISIDLPIPAHIPETYVPDLNLRLALYQRLSEATALDGVEAIQQEMEDRFGPPPPIVHNLLDVVRLRVLAQRAGVQSLAVEEGRIVVRLKEGLEVPREALEGRAPKGVHVGRTLVRLDMVAAGATWREVLQETLEALAGAMVTS